jgi:hypothetical protein
LPTVDPNDPNYRRLYYIRYADDTLFGFAGPKKEIEEIKQRLSDFLRDTLKLELSQEKTLITHARTEAARFLGYEIVTQHNDQKRDRSQHRNLNGHIGLRLPNDVIEKKLTLYMRDGKPVSRPELLFNEDYSRSIEDSSNTTCLPKTSPGFGDCTGLCRPRFLKHWHPNINQV